MVIHAVDWQHPESYLDEQGDDELCGCGCGKWYWCYGVSHCPHCGAENPCYEEVDEILCRTKSAADAMADMLQTLYWARGKEVTVNTGYYDPEEDERIGETDSYTGW